MHIGGRLHRRWLVCAAIDDNDRRAIFNGVTWSPPSGGSLAFSPSAISCPQPHDCVESDSNEGGGEQSDLSCVTASFCVSVGDDGGVGDAILHGLDLDIDPYGPLASVSCPTESFCAAVGENRGVIYYS